MDLNSSQRSQAHTWLRNNIIGLVALFVALSGTTYAAQAVNDPGATAVEAAKKKKKKKKKQSPAAPTPAAPSTNALTLGGLPASSYQQRCTSGAALGFATIDTTGASPTLSDVPGFNCNGGAVQLSRTSMGDYLVNFAGSSATVAVATVADPNPNLAKQIWVRNDAPGLFKFEIETSGGGNVDDAAFSIVVF